MHNNDKLAVFLQERKLSLCSPIIYQNQDSEKAIAFVYTSYDSNGIQRPSERKLTGIKKDVEEIFKLEIDFVLQNQRLVELEQSLRVKLLERYKDVIETSFTTFNSGGATVLIIPQREIDEGESFESELKQFIKDFFSASKVKFKNVHIRNKVKTISKTACASIIRRYAPIRGEDLAKKIREQGFDLPSEAWLPTMLNDLQSNSIIFKKQNGSFVMTLDGLNRMGTAMSRQSPDVRRMLALKSKS